MGNGIIWIERDSLLQKRNAIGSFVHLRKGHPKVGERTCVLRFGTNNLPQQFDGLRNPIHTLQHNCELVCGLARLGLQFDGVLKNRN